MMLRPVISKKAYLAAILHDLYHIPTFTQHDHIYVYNVGDFSKLLFVGYVLEKYGLWGRMLRAIIGKYIDGEIEKYMEILDTVNIFRWGLIEAELELTAEKVVEKYNALRDKIVDSLKRILDIEKLYSEIYLIMGFNPQRGLYGSMLFDERDYVIVSVMVGVDNDPNKIVDLTIHEILHGLIKLNRIPISEDLEEEFIDTLCPEGYLSRLLGLSETLNIGGGYIQSIIGAYFNEKLYEKNISLIKYFMDKLKNTYLA